MKLTFLGAGHEVTGSRTLLQAGGYNIMVDYGMEQGTDLFENPDLPLPAGEIDAVLLTHAHIDHSGMIPALVKQGFRGQIFATEATAQLCGIMLMDSAHIQESEAEWRNRKAERAGQPPVEPVYTIADAQAALQPPATSGRRLKIYYATQQGIQPPTFVMFVNDETLMHFSYERYLEKQFRKSFGFEGTPLKFILREKKRDEQ